MNHFLHQSLTVFVTPSIYTLVKDFVPIFFIKKDQAYKHTRYATLVLTEREREREREREIGQFQLKKSANSNPIHSSFKHFHFKCIEKKCREAVVAQLAERLLPTSGSNTAVSNY